MRSGRPVWRDAWPLVLSTPDADDIVEMHSGPDEFDLQVLSLLLAGASDARVARQIQLVWGVRPFVAQLEVGSLEDIVNVVERELLAANLVVPGDRIIILMGHPVRERPLANLMRVHRIRPA